jgi:hypothetical protein
MARPLSELELAWAMAAVGWDEVAALTGSEKAKRRADDCKRMALRAGRTRDDGRALVLEEGPSPT